MAALALPAVSGLWLLGDPAWEWLLRSSSVNTEVTGQDMEVTGQDMEVTGQDIEVIC